jgi:hypothetical protein
MATANYITVSNGTSTNNLSIGNNQSCYTTTATATVTNAVYGNWYAGGSYMPATEIYSIPINKDLKLFVYKYKNNCIGVEDLKTMFHNTENGSEVTFFQGDIVKFTDLEQAKAFIKRIKLQYKKMEMINRQCNADKDFV